MSRSILPPVRACSRCAFGAALAVAAAAVAPAQDFNGDGFPDLAIGVPGETIGDRLWAGAVTVLYGGPGGLSDAGNQFWSEDSPGIAETAEDRENFGSALTYGDFDGDGFDDLAIGVPFAILGANAVAGGAVHVLYGGPAGLSASGSEFWTQDSPGVPDQAEINDRFGAALGAGDFDGDGDDELVVGIPAEARNVNREGALQYFRGGPGGLEPLAQGFATQDSRGVADQAEELDSFAGEFATGDFDGDGFADLAVAVHEEWLGDLRSAGALHAFYGSPGGLTARGLQFWHQDVPGVLDQAEIDDRFAATLSAGDFNGDGRDDLAIGVILEDLTGAVNVLYGGASGLQAAGNQVWTQDSPGILDDPDFLELFGDALAAGDFDGDGVADLAIGVRGEDTPASLPGSGAVAVLYGGASGLTSAGNQLWRQGSDGIPGTPTVEDQFGFSLAAGDFDGDGRAELAIGSPFDGSTAGTLIVIPGGLTGTGSQLWTQDRGTVLDAVELGDQFGFALGRR